LWFQQIESRFGAQRIRGDQDRFNFVMSALDNETMLDVSDVIYPAPTTNKYETLKVAILARTTESPDRKLNKLLSEIEL
ncbi:hypothetical protein NL518_29850, partial [Klebsiella pneumoniae]|nr:hypothetical protein [Klebsiella pneumoniae]